METQDWVHQHPNLSLHGAVELADTFHTARESRQRELLPPFASGSGLQEYQQHRVGRGKRAKPGGQGSEERPQAVKGHWTSGLTGQTGYKSHSLPKREPGGNSPPHRKAVLPGTFPNVQCFECKEYGHYASGCPNRGELDMDCSLVTTISSVPPVLSPHNKYLIPVEVEGNSTTALLDSGSVQTLISGDLVSWSKVDNVPPIKISCIHGDVVSYPSTVVSIRTEAGIRNVKAGVLPSLAYPTL
nr:PREDICTED: uncharacterized protein LOC106705651 [Latimeria chalumnae]|eukprot:XP_014350951.1 PREDICTED: uncharacterized protein LOC106705651 [Latimeria chalumnae]